MNERFVLRVCMWKLNM